MWNSDSIIGKNASGKPSGVVVGGMIFIIAFIVDD